MALWYNKMIKNNKTLDIILSISTNVKIPATTLIIEYENLNKFKCYDKNYILGCMYAHYMNTYKVVKK